VAAGVGEPAGATAALRDDLGLELARDLRFFFTGSFESSLGTDFLAAATFSGFAEASGGGVAWG
jgi:hypothetical protein